MFISKYILYIKVYKYICLQIKAQPTLHIHSVNMNTQVLCNKCSKNLKIYYCTYCDFKSKRKYNVKIQMQRKHAHILDQEDVGEDIDRARVCTPFTESNEMHVKDEAKDPELLEDSIEVLKIYKLLQRMKNK